MTVDTEADDQWKLGTALTTSNVRHWEPFQLICSAYSAPPTYLVTSEIAADPLAQTLLSSWIGAGQAEVGAHLHPWTTPPYRDESGFRFNDRFHPFMSELPPPLVRAKLENLTREIHDQLGVSPTSFKAGRYGLDATSARVLAELGYIVDSSVTPLTNWQTQSGLPGGPGGPDFSQHSSRPFLIDGTGDPGLLEIPVSILPTYSVLRRFPRLLGAYNSLPARALRRWTHGRWFPPQPIWLHPAYDEYALPQLTRAYELSVRAFGVAVMMVHSSELMPAGSPRTPTESSVEGLLARLERFLEFLSKRGEVFLTLSEAAHEIRAREAVPVRRL